MKMVSVAHTGQNARYWRLKIIPFSLGFLVTIPSRKNSQWLSGISSKFNLYWKFSRKKMAYKCANKMKLGGQINRSANSFNHSLSVKIGGDSCGKSHDLLKTLLQNRTLEVKKITFFLFLISAWRISFFFGISTSVMFVFMVTDVSHIKFAFVIQIFWSLFVKIKQTRWIQLDNFSKEIAARILEVFQETPSWG